MVFRARPESPEVAVDATWAPELAPLMAVPTERALPVRPLRPERPEVASPPTAMAVPRMAVFSASGMDSASPVSPVSPEFPEMADGAAVAVEVAAPVLPVLVALACEVASPVLPVVVSGVSVRLVAPPAPPLDWPVATLAPPAATGLPLTAPGVRRRRDHRSGR